MEYDGSSDEEVMNGDEPSDMGQLIRDSNAKGIVTTLIFLHFF